MPKTQSVGQGKQVAFSELAGSMTSNSFLYFVVSKERQLEFNAMRLRDRPLRTQMGHHCD